MERTYKLLNNMRLSAKELMIGDWVLYCDIQIKIEQIIHTTGGEDMQPIPLTPDILEKNGFNENLELHANDNAFLEYDKCNNHLRAFYLVCGDKVLYMDICIIHVHELQHALRLCGLNSLADNLKV